jgi:uncharacterized lipoprotein YddW (UPF0748 family)
MKTLLCAVFVMVLSMNVGAQQLPLKREARAAWIATVTNIDWPTPNTTVDQQKSQLISIFNSLQAAGVNIAVFQIRSECDAMYNSPYEPWSQWLTGHQGIAPNPMWDPLEFAVAEAHKRGMELHAWFNPYRAERSVGNYATASTHVTNVHPEWVLQIGSIKFLNPGLQQVRDYVTKIISDVVRRYDIDAAHMDDYFYVQGITTQDAATFAANNPSNLTLADWRRDNVNRLVKAVYDSIQIIKPWVKWGISPSGIWKSGVPAGITGMSHYDELYCDPVTWMNGKYIDYLAPQLYWKIGGSQDFTKLLPWWNSVANGRQMFPGLAVYRILSGTSAYPSASEIMNQIRFQHANSTVKGVFLYTTNNITGNQGGITDSLKNDLYKYHALVPPMDWKDQIAPNAPRNIRFGRMQNSPVATITWDVPAKASDNDTASLYVVYQPGAPSAVQSVIDDARNITSVTNQRAFNPLDSKNPSKNYFVTALDRNHNESAPSAVITLADLPAQVALALPADNAANQTPAVQFAWNYADASGGYQLQVASDSTFASTVYSSTLADTTVLVAGLKGERSYYWRVKGFNLLGDGAYSPVRKFTTGFPAATVLLAPGDLMTNVPFTVQFAWQKNPVASSYNFQFSKTSDFSTTLADTAGLSDTTITRTQLDPYTLYFWRVRSVNAVGASDWASRKFRTQPATAVKPEEDMPTAFRLGQNYPNPFNPETNIQFSVSAAGHVQLDIYDVLGRTVASLIDREMQPGMYSVQWNGAGAPSGIYFYRLKAGSFSEVKKMLLQK